MIGNPYHSAPSTDLIAVVVTTTYISQVAAMTMQCYDYIFASHCMMDCVDFILQSLDYEVKLQLSEMEESLSRNKMMKKLTIWDGDDVTLPKQLCCHLLLGIKINMSLLDVHLKFNQQNWHCPVNGGLGYILLCCVDNMTIKG